MNRFVSLAVICSLAWPAMALAQEDVVAEEVEVETVEPAPEPPKEAIEDVPSPKVAADDMQAEYAGEAGDESRPFLDGLSWQLMASAFYNFNGYRVSGPYNDLEPDPVARSSYPYTNFMGFGLNFVGGDVMYTGEKFALRLDLRWGTGAPLLTPLFPVKQGYAAWMPHERVSLDFGFFDTIFGAEVADEWQNANYTRGALYFLRQPFNHMGVRMGVEMTEIAGFTFMLTNGTPFGGTPVDDNQVPSVGWQFGFSPDGQRSVRRRALREGSREVGLFFGGNHGPDGSNGNRDWVSFFDVVLSLNFDWFTLLLNGDYFVDANDVDFDGNKATNFQYGGSLALIFDIDDHWGIGLRGEHLSGNTQYRDFGGPINPDLTFGFLWTGTLTIRYKPVEYLVLSLEGRVEGAGENIYFTRSSPTFTDPATGEDILQPNEKIYGAVILGVTAHIGN
ncbi:MAG: porin [Myxococcales bacterium]|nr:porin [Myxococcales bacterium]